MSTITTKFNINGVCYTFDNEKGIIYRSVIKEIFTTVKNNDIEINYTLMNTTPPVNATRLATGTEYEQNLYTEEEIKDVCNTWLVNKSISVFRDAGL